MEGTADIAVGAMTINFARESVIDFTKAGGQYWSLIGWGWLSAESPIGREEHGRFFYWSEGVI